MRKGQAPRQWLQSKLSFFFFFKAECFKSGLEQISSSPPPTPTYFFSFPFPLLFLDVKALIATVWKTFLKPGWVPLARASSRPQWIHTWSRTGSFLGILGQGSCKDQQMEWVRELACHWQENWSSLVPLLWVTGSPLYFLFSVSLGFEYNHDDWEEASGRDSQREWTVRGFDYHLEFAEWG